MEGPAVGSLEGALQQFENTQQQAPAQQPQQPAAPDATQTQEPTPQPQQQPQQPQRTPAEIFGQAGPIANKSFAELRAQNTQYRTILSKLGGMIGVQDTSNPDALVSALNERIIAFQNQSTGVPKDLLERVDTLDSFYQKYQQEQTQSAALIGFQKVKDTYKLSDADLSAFAQQLDAAGKNPFVSPMDLLTEYKMMNYDKLVQMAADQAVKAALGIQQNAVQNSTTPVRATSPAQPTAQKTTLQGLSEILKDFK